MWTTKVERYNGIRLYVRRDVASELHSAEGSIYVNAAMLHGTVIGNAHAHVTAGTDALLWGKSDIQAGVTAGRDLEVWTLGDVAGATWPGETPG